MTRKWHGPLLAGCAFFFALAAAQPRCRLVGTIELEAGESIAIVDVGDGRQQLVHVGDQLAIGEIVSIVDQEVVVRTTTGLIVLPLEGIPAPPLPEGEPPPVVTDMRIDSASLLRLRGIGGSDERRVTRDVLQELGLPKDLTVREVWVAGKQYSQMRLALPDIQSALQASDMAHLFFENGGPIDEIYLMSDVQPSESE